MGKKIVIVGTGAVGGYAGAHMVQAGEDVTFIDPWPAHVEHMRKHGLRVTHARGRGGIHCAGAGAAFHRRAAARQGQAGRHRLRLHEVLRHGLGGDDDRPIPGPRRLLVSLQNCMNEETIAGVVGWGKTLGCIASTISVNLPEPATSTAVPANAARRTPCSGRARCTAASPQRAEEVVGWSAMPTAPRPPPTCGANAGRNSSPTSWVMASRRAPASPGRRCWT